jgi:hypothetical protein
MADSDLAALVSAKSEALEIEYKSWTGTSVAESHLCPENCRALTSVCRSFVEKLGRVIAGRGDDVMRLVVIKPALDPLLKK